MYGTCLSSDVCEANKGTADGNCASGKPTCQNCLTGARQLAGIIYEQPNSCHNYVATALQK